MKLHDVYLENEVGPYVGSVVHPDGWNIADSYPLLESFWDRADFRLPTGKTAGVTSLAVNVEVTGRTIQRRPWSDLEWVRVKIVFVGDGEPDVEHRGWMQIQSHLRRNRRCTLNCA